jgi:hypothetical protein
VICKAAMFALSLLVVSQSSVPSDADWAWLDEHRERAFDALMPIAPAPGQLVAYRRYRDLYQDVPEAHFAIGMGDRPVSGPAKLRAVVTSPTSGSIQQQLLQLHMTNRRPLPGRLAATCDDSTADVCRRPMPVNSLCYVS